MTPITSIASDSILQDTIYPSKTYSINDNKIRDLFDGLEALQQAIYKFINTERYNYPIYGYYYGIELESLIGKDKDYVSIELKRRIQEGLMQDERILSVDDFKIDSLGDEIHCSFTVHSIYGELSITKEVNI